jgi:23S rRNA (adenine2503-C2)-methyltransferase
MGCVFCASGVAGLKRHLGAEEIVGQVLLGRAQLDDDEELRNVVYMGMGEPLHNYEATKRSLELLTHPEGIGLSKRKVTVSTSGLVPEILRLGADFGGQIGLAISLHAADDETRGALMPINRKYPLSELMAALARYPLPKRRRITIEYTLVLGKNDSAAEAKKLVRLLRGLPVKINLIPMNPIEASTLGPPDPQARVLAFQEILVARATLASCGAAWRRRRSRVWAARPARREAQGADTSHAGLASLERLELARARPELAVQVSSFNRPAEAASRVSRAERGRSSGSPRGAPSRGRPSIAFVPLLVRHARELR